MAAPFFDEEKLIKDNLAGNAVQEIRLFLAEEKLPKLRDEQIMLFLMSCDNDKNFTKETIKIHYQIKKNYPKYFTNWNVERPDFQYQLSNSL